jgi:hypothetical protein
MAEENWSQLTGRNGERFYAGHHVLESMGLGPNRKQVSPRPPVVC